MNVTHRMPPNIAKAIQDWFLETPEVNFPGTQRLEGRFRQIDRHPIALSAARDFLGVASIRQSAHGLFLTVDAAERLLSAAMISMATSPLSEESLPAPSGDRGQEPLARSNGAGEGDGSSGSRDDPAAPTPASRAS